jgi:8-oxo-dGTP diphosphatase
MIEWIYYKILQLSNLWEECKEPGWIKRPHLYGATMYVQGHTFRYKLVGQADFTQGYDPVICYRKYRNWYLKKKAGILKEHNQVPMDKHRHEHHGHGAYERRRGTAIVDTPKGILVVRQGHARFLLPGGGARNNESRYSATIRELREETGLVAQETWFLFEHQMSKVFLVETTGTPTPKHEISQIAYYTKGSNIPLSSNTKLIIERYWNMTKTKGNNK